MNFKIQITKKGLRISLCLYKKFLEKFAKIFLERFLSRHVPAIIYEMLCFFVVVVCVCVWSLLSCHLLILYVRLVIVHLSKNTNHIFGLHTHTQEKNTHIKKHRNLKPFYRYFFHHATLRRKPPTGQRIFSHRERERERVEQ